MASDPAGLIREVDAALDGITPGLWSSYTPNPRHNPTDRVVFSETLREDPLARGWEVAEGVRAGDAEFIAAAPDLVRRLRDALEDAHAARCPNCEHEGAVAESERFRAIDAIEALVEACGHIRAIADYAGADADVLDILRRIREMSDERANLRTAIRQMQENNFHREAALAEANATIARITNEVDSWGDETSKSEKWLIRRVLRGEQP